MSPVVEFERLAHHGFGDPQNAYAHSMAWWQGHVLVGTTRNNLCLVRSNPRRDVLGRWPVRTPEDIYKLDMRAQIWSCDTRHDSWRCLHVSPLVRGTGGRDVPREIGYRSMAVFQGRSDPVPALYITTMSWTESPPAGVLRTLDGEEFTPVSSPRTGATSFRALTPFGGRLFTSPAGQGTSFYRAQSAAVLVSDDPATGVWDSASEPGFGDPSNTAISALTAFDGHLYAGTLNPCFGFQVWRTDAAGAPPYRWTKVIDDGAWRGRLNEGVLTFCPFDGALYVGGHISMGGHDKRNGVGPAAAELIRLYPDGSWDLVAGTPRDTDDGYKEPLSGLGPGFGNPFAGYVWSMAHHNGRLYLGTFDSAIFAEFADLDRQRPGARMLLQQVGGVDRLIEERGGFDLWESHDGEDWEPITETGFGNPYNYGLRNLLSTDAGLFAGTANPFGPQVSVATAAGRSAYVDNPDGGAEVWRLEDHVPRTGAGGPLAAMMDNGSNAIRSATAHADTMSQMNAGYDEVLFDDVIDRYYSESDFANWGLWRPDTKTQKEACENLMEELVGLLPRLRGTVLDVACGKGATTRHLLRHFAPHDVTGINVSRKQLERCRENAPGCRFLLMDATDLDFADESFDVVISVEAAFHFDSRERFFEEAARVLKPGGTLALSDILLTRASQSGGPGLPAANWVDGRPAYRALLEGAGFYDVHVTDVTTECWLAYARHKSRYLQEIFALGEIDRVTLAGFERRLRGQVLTVRNYVIAAATKPVKEAS